jgi:hypothetical protein
LHENRSISGVRFKRVTGWRDFASAYPDQALMVKGVLFCAQFA